MATLTWRTPALTRLALILGSLGALSACSSLPKPFNSNVFDGTIFDSKPAPTTRSTRSGSADTGSADTARASQSAYAEGLRLYRQGDYAGALPQFAAVQTPPSLRVQALKYSAFSQCVTNQLGACEQSFAQALAISPSFRLSASERGHPVWGPIFNKALQARGR